MKLADKIKEFEKQGELMGEAGNNIINLVVSGLYGSTKKPKSIIKKGYKVKKEILQDYFNEETTEEEVEETIIKALEMYLDKRGECEYGE